MNYNAFASATPDRENATYRHEARTLGGKTIVGYSKKMGFNETADKRRLFVTSMARLLPSFFGERTDIWQVQVFRRLPERKNGMYTETLVATFTSSEWLFHNGFEKDQAITECIRSIYSGGDRDRVNTLLKSYNDFTFDPQRDTYETLVQRCSNLLQFHDRGLVERFFFAVKKQYFPTIDTAQPTQPNTPAQAPPPTPKRTGTASPLKDFINASFQ